MMTVKHLLGSPVPRPPMGPHPQWHAAHTDWRSPLPWGPIVSTGQRKDKCFAEALGYEPSLHPDVPQLLLQALRAPGCSGMYGTCRA